MSFPWVEFFYLSRRLAAIKAEAELRSAISRAYYAAFILCRNFLRDKEKVIIPGGYISHQFVVDRFRASRNRTRRDIAYKLSFLRSLRNAADYDDTVTGLSKKTNRALKLADEIISALNSL